LSLLDQARATPGARAVTPVAQHVEFGGENALGLRQIDGVDFEDFRRVTSGLLIALFARPALAAWAGLKIEIEVGYTLCAALGGLASSLMGAIYPALRAAGQDAVEALNYE
jgi:ABC-type lipoprotein release transport system permease subunit